MAPARCGNGVGQQAEQGSGALTLTLFAQQQHLRHHDTEIVQRLAERITNLPKIKDVNGEQCEVDKLEPFVVPKATDEFGDRAPRGVVGHRHDQ